MNCVIKNGNMHIPKLVLVYCKNYPKHLYDYHNIMVLIPYQKFRQRDDVLKQRKELVHDVLTWCVK